MEDSTISAIQSLIRSQRIFFNTNETKGIKFRIERLKSFKSAILRYEERISEALWLDLHKSREEAYLTEISIVLQEIDNHLRHLKCWTKPRRKKTPLQLLPSSSKIITEPLGVTLIIAPWNYPFQLMLNPLVGAISAGCCAVLKPSPYTPHIAAVMESLVSETFKPDHVGMVQGGRAVNQHLLEQRFDLIFFTGSPSLGKIVMKAAAQFLTPVVLELGGKSPCIVGKEADLKVAAKRIVWGKCINAGQTCIAPDYLFVHKSVKSRLIEFMIQAVEELYGNDPKNNSFYPRIVNEQAMERLQKLMVHGKIRYGGAVDNSQKYISPTFIDEVRPDYPIMQEEIFGPLLPILTYSDIDEAIDYVNANEKPLAFYYFGSNKLAKEILLKTTSGGGCINDTLMHIANHHLPFGGVGNSGMNNYHGRSSFLVFSHERSIVSSPVWLDLPFKYPPFKFFPLVKRIL